MGNKDTKKNYISSSNTNFIAIDTKSKKAKHSLSRITKELFRGDFGKYRIHSVRPNNK